MKPILYPDSETEFSTNGLGILTDAVSCTVTEELNGSFELEMEYPVSGIHYEDIAPRCIIMAKPNPYDDPQQFRIYRITRPMSGTVAIYAQHLSYDLGGVPVSPFTASSAVNLMQQLAANAAVAHGFSFQTDSTASGSLAVEVPSSARSVIFSGRDLYGGDLEFDRWTVRLLSHRGVDDGVTIRYGKNLTDLNQEENIQNMATGIYPYWASSDGTIVEVPGKIVECPGTYDFVNVIPVDLSGEFTEMPTPSELEQAAEAYITANSVGVPEVSLEVRFYAAPPEDTAALEAIRLGDTVSVYYTRLGVSATARCSAAVYNVLLDRYDSVTLGDVQQTVADTIASQQAAIGTKVSSYDINTAVSNQVSASTGWLTDEARGYITSIIQNSIWQALMIKDSEGETTAQHVLRFSQSGLDASNSGQGGPWRSVLDIAAQLLQVPVIQAGSGKVQLSGGTDEAGNSLAGCIQGKFLRVGDAYYYDGGDGVGLVRAALSTKLPSEVTT